MSCPKSPSNRSLGRIPFLPSTPLSLGFKQKPPPPPPWTVSVNAPGVTTLRKPLLCPTLGAHETAKKPELVTVQSLFQWSPKGQGAATSILGFLYFAIIGVLAQGNQNSSCLDRNKNNRKKRS